MKNQSYPFILCLFYPNLDILSTHLNFPCSKFKAISRLASN